jgi:hypothetical protein
MLYTYDMTTKQVVKEDRQRSAPAGSARGTDRACPLAARPQNRPGVDRAVPAGSHLDLMPARCAQAMSSLRWRRNGRKQRFDLHR